MKYLRNKARKTFFLTGVALILSFNSAFGTGLSYRESAMFNNSSVKKFQIDDAKKYEGGGFFFVVNKLNISTILLNGLDNTQKASIVADINGLSDGTCVIHFSLVEGSSFKPDGVFEIKRGNLEKIRIDGIDNANEEASRIEGTDDVESTTLTPVDVESMESSIKHINYCMNNHSNLSKINPLEFDFINSYFKNLAQGKSICLAVVYDKIESILNGGFLDGTKTDERSLEAVKIGLRGDPSEFGRSVYFIKYVKHNGVFVAVNVSHYNVNTKKEVMLEVKNLNDDIVKSIEGYEKAKVDSEKKKQEEVQKAEKEKKAAELKVNKERIINDIKTQCTTLLSSWKSMLENKDASYDVMKGFVEEDMNKLGSDFNDLDKKYNDLGLNSQIGASFLELKNGGEALLKQKQDQERKAIIDSVKNDDSSVLNLKIANIDNELISKVNSPVFEGMNSLLKRFLLEPARSLGDLEGKYKVLKKDVEDLRKKTWGNPQLLDKSLYDEERLVLLNLSDYLGHNDRKTSLGFTVPYGKSPSYQGAFLAGLDLYEFMLSVNSDGKLNSAITGMNRMLKKMENPKKGFFGGFSKRNLLSDRGDLKYLKKEVGEVVLNSDDARLMNVCFNVLEAKVKAIK